MRIFLYVKEHFFEGLEHMKSTRRVSEVIKESFC